MALDNTVNWGENYNATIAGTAKTTLFDKKPTRNANRGFVLFIKGTSDTGTVDVEWIDGLGNAHTIESFATANGTLYIKDYDYSCGHIKVSMTADTGPITVTAWFGLYGA